MFGNKYFGKEWFAETYFGPGGKEDLLGGKDRGKLTDREIAGLKVIFDKETKPELPEVSILDIEIPVEQEVQLIPESELVPVSQYGIELQDRLETEEDIGLLLAMIEAHEN